MNRFINADEVAEELGISKPYAYKIIRRLNEELREKGMITIAGRVDRNYFNERYQRLFLIFNLSVLKTHACQCIIVSED